MSYTSDGGFLVECMEEAGYTPDSALAFINAFADTVKARVLENSDHTAYRELADEVHKIIDSESVPDDWDGDDSELHVLTVFLHWLPDMIRHADAEKIRKAEYPPHATDGAEYSADTIDPFRLDNGEWTRKSDGVRAPATFSGTPGS